MRALGVLVAVAAAVMAVAAAHGSSDEAPRLIDALTAGIPAAELTPEGAASVQADAEAAAARLDGDATLATECASTCKAATGPLERVCVGLIQPPAARSLAICYARAAEKVDACLARCPR